MSVPDTVFLFDVDNTLVDNDRVTQDLRRFLDKEVGVRRTIWVPCSDIGSLIRTTRIYWLSRPI
jgi:hypothetical protein